MQLFLMRHGEAKESAQDPARPLTDAGRAAVEEVTRDARARGMRVDHIYHSGVLRAQQTAELLAATLGVVGAVEMRPGLQPDDNPEPVARWLSGQAQTDPEGVILLVGHLPFVERLTARLTTGRDRQPGVRFPPAGLVKLVPDEKSRHFTLEWMLEPHRH